jgi:hypothetical protein
MIPSTGPLWPPGHFSAGSDAELFFGCFPLRLREVFSSVLAGLARMISRGGATAGIRSHCIECVSFIRFYQLGCSEIQDAGGSGAYNRYFGRLDTGKMKILGVMTRKGDTPAWM